MDVELLIRRYYGAFNARDFDAMLDCVADTLLHLPNQGTQRIGKPAFRDFLLRMDRCYSEQLSELVVMTDATGAHAAASFMIHGVYKDDDEGMPAARGQTYVLRGGAFLGVADGRITRIATAYNVQDWLAQVRG